MSTLKKAPNRVSRYPLEFRQILMRLLPDGTPFAVKYPSASDATRERMQFYNFLRFLKRNPIESAQFGTRPELCVLTISGETLSFSLRKGRVSSTLAQALAEASGEDALEAETPIALDFSAVITNINDQDFAQLQAAVEADMPERNAGIDAYFNAPIAQVQALVDNVKSMPKLSARAEAMRKQAEEIRQDNIVNGLDPDRNIGVENERQHK